MTTGQRIKAARKQAGMTQSALGKELGISYQTVAQWENDLRKPKQETLLKIAKALGVHLRDLSDNSWLEEFDRQHPEAVKQINEGHTAQIPDESEIILFKDGHTATFTQAEFEELQSGAKEAIEGRFYKKVLEQQK